MARSGPLATRKCRSGGVRESTPAREGHIGRGMGGVRPLGWAVSAHWHHDGLGAPRRAGCRPCGPRRRFPGPHRAPVPVARRARRPGALAPGILPIVRWGTPPRRAGESRKSKTGAQAPLKVNVNGPHRGDKPSGFPGVSKSCQWQWGLCREHKMSQVLYLKSVCCAIPPKWRIQLRLELKCGPGSETAKCKVRPWYQSHSPTHPPTHSAAQRSAEHSTQTHTYWDGGLS